MIISGLTSNVPRPTSNEDKKKWLKDIVAKVLDSIEGGASSEIYFITQGRSNDRDVPLAEVRMKTKEMATNLRKKFANLKKTGKDFGRINISNCVTLATRVRIDIMKAMAKKFKSEREDLFVFGYTSRPVLHVKPRDTNQRPMWLAFSDALIRYGSGLEETDLGEAYRRAGIAFRGQLQQNFVVLRDKFVVETPRSKNSLATGANADTPKKRARENEGAKNDSDTPRKRQDNKKSN